MAYNSYYDIEQIVGLKGAYDEAKKKNNQAAMNESAQKAQEYYNSLIKNGYGSIASQLKNSGYSDAQKIKIAAGTQGKTAIRPYLYSLGKQYGLTQKDVDEALSYNSATGEVSLGGKNIGTPDTNVDGVTYWDADKLSKIWGDYAAETGLSKTPETQYGQGIENIQKKLDDTYNLTMSDHKNMNDKYDRLEKFGYSNPYDTEIAESIMDDYKWKGQVASDEAVASGGGSNGGNIDSYSAANASRQQLAFTNAGKAAVLADFNSKIANLRGVLSDLGAYNQGVYNAQHQNAQLDMQNNQRVFENTQTEKANQVANDLQIAQMTGYVPESMKPKNIFFNDDGTLIDVDNTDYQAIINNAQARLEKTTDAAERANLQETIRQATEARNYKINNYDRYRQWSDTMTAVAPQRTADYELTTEQMASNERMNQDNNDTTRYNSDNALALGKYQADSSLALGKYQSDKNLEGIKDTNSVNRYATDREFDLQKWMAQNGLSTASSSETEYKPKLTAEQAKQAVEIEGNTSESVLRDYQYYWGGASDAVASSNSDAASGQTYGELYNSLSKYAKDYNYSSVRDIPKSEVINFVIQSSASDETKDRFLSDLGVTVADLESVANFVGPLLGATNSNANVPTEEYGSVYNKIINAAISDGWTASKSDPKSIPKMLVKNVVASSNASDATKQAILRDFDAL